MPPIHLDPAWQALKAHRTAMDRQHMRQLFEQDPGRFPRYTLEAAGLFLDYSKNRITDETLTLLLDLARACAVPERIAAMRRGEHINRSEDRAALHVALRQTHDAPLICDGVNVIPQVRAVQAQMARFCAEIHSGAWRGHTGQRIDTVVNIGIGGSDLGPRMVCEALASCADQGIRTLFLSNLDGYHTRQVLAGLNPATTLFVVVSKSFTTQETLVNAHAARAWLVAAAGDAAAVGRHFVAVTVNQQAATDFGVDAANLFGFWDWVGGRYSLWSAVGLSIALQIGWPRFQALLAGAAAMDEHFFSAPAERNLPILLALLGVWYNTFHKAHTHAVIPYHHPLSHLVGHLQQLDMESNGKQAGLDGEALDFDTAPIIWGDVGTNCQHAFFQLLHQGTRLIPVDYIVCAEPAPGFADTHTTLLANCLAQSQALMKGKTEAEARADMSRQTLTAAQMDALLPHKVFPGNQPSNTLILPRIDPWHLGALIAAYEHKVFVQGVIWNINSFDQWGVEYGKQLARTLEPLLRDPSCPHGHDASTLGLMERLRRRPTDA